MKYNKIFGPLLFFGLLILQIQAQMSFVLRNYTVAPNYARSVSSLYTFPFYAYNTVLGVMNLRVDFPNQFQLTGVTNCQVKIQSVVIGSTSCSLDSSTNEVVINNIRIASTFSTLDIQFRTMTSKYSATTSVQFNFYNASTSALITSNSQFVKIQNAIMTCSLSSNSTIVGASSIYTVKFQPTVQIQANSMVQLQFDTWGPFTKSNFGSANSTSVCANQCTMNLLSRPPVELLIFLGLFSSATNNQKSITLNMARNPSSSYPINLKITILASDRTRVYMNGSTTFAATQANTFSGITFDNPKKQISGSNSNINLRVIPRNPMNWDTYLRIIYAPGISCSYIFGFSSLLSTPFQVSGQSANQILLGNLTRTTISSQPALLSLGNFTLVNPPYSQKPVSLTFRTQQLIASKYYLMDETTIQITSTPSTIAQSGLKATVTSIGSVTTYTLWFVTVNKLTSESFIQITFPTQINLTVNQSSCLVSNPLILYQCVVGSITSIKVLLDSNLNPGTNLSFTITKVTNPMTTVPTDSFTIRTYYMDEASLVDQLNNGLTFTATQVPLRTVTVTPSSFVVYAKTPYTFLVQSSFQIPTSSSIRVIFPSQFTQGGQVLQSFSIDGTAVTGCILAVSNTTYLQFSNLCIKSSVKNSSTISFVLSNITNPTSLKPTSSFIIWIYNGIYKQQYLDTGILVTMKQTTNISYFKVTPSSYVANEVTEYAFQANFLMKHYSGDRIIVKLPSQITLSTIFDCSSQTQNMTISCSKTNSQTLLFILNYNSTIYPTFKVKFTVQNFTNNWYASTKTLTIQTTTNDTTYYYREQGSAVISYQPSKIISTINVDNSIVLLGQSKLTLTLASPFRLQKASNISLLYITVQVPTDLVPKTNTCVFSYGASTCNQSSAQMFNITNIGDFSSQMTLKFTAQTSYFENSSTFDIKLFYGSSIVLLNSQVKTSRYCSSPCKQCTVNKTQCLSCLPLPYATQTIYFPFNSSCLNSCPNTYYLISSNKSCGRCNQTLCNTCENSATQCTSCVTGKYLYNKICLSTCPNGYYALNGECLICQSPCDTCSGSANLCLTCISNYFLDYGTNNTRCIQVCSNTNYLGIDGQCKQCQQNCKTCSGVLNNCTSCDETNYLFYSNSCIRNCPVGMYSNPSKACVNCQSPCQTCSSRNLCSTCVSSYYMFNGTTCVRECPNGYIQNVNQCKICGVKCGTCKVTAQNCTSCASGYYFYQNQCFSQCPALTYPYNRTCTKCINPCVTCTSSPQICLTCIDGLLQMNNSCVTACSSYGYIEEDKRCLKCPQDCLACSSTVTCTLCTNSYNLLQGGCVSQCPTNYPIKQNRQCFQCSSVCLTCQVSRQNCTSCRLNSFKHLYTCVQICPLGYYSNIQTYECQDGLSSKIVFFPILILSGVLIALVSVGKCLTMTTSLTTSLTAILSLAQLAIWVYMIVEVAYPIKQLDVDYVLPIVMITIAFVFLVVQNIAFFILQLRRMENDSYVKGWAMNNVNYTVLTIHRYVGLIINFKFFRLVYSKLLNMRTLSLPFQRTQNVFPLTTIFSISNFLLCQIPIMVGSFSLVYKKRLRDQLFYTSVECLVITILCAILLFIDIFKSDDYFQENDYVKTRKYLEKIKDASFNRIQDNFDISKDQGSVQGQKYISKTGGKFIFHKQDAASLNDMFFQQQLNGEAGSIITDAIDTIQGKQQQQSGRQTKKGRRINIFEPIKQEDEEIYQALKYSQSQIRTQAQIQIQKRESANRHKQQDHAIQYSQQKNRRRNEFGVNTQQFGWDDNKSMIEQRQIRNKWNNIISHRQNLAKSIFNTLDEYSTKQLQKIVEPINEDQYESEEGKKRIQDPFRLTEYGKTKKNKRRRRKQVNHVGNSQLQKIYLQRLTEKKQYKDVFSSSQSVKYDF